MTDDPNAPNKAHWIGQARQAIAQARAECERPAVASETETTSPSEERADA